MPDIKFFWFIVLHLAASLQSAEILERFGSGENEFSIAFVHVGSPGNLADTNGNPVPAGAVSYEYQIGKYEVNREAIEKANAEDGLGISLDNMEYLSVLSSNSTAEPLHPATGISWNEAARFVNWLNVSKGFPPAYKFSRQPGDQDYDVQENPGLWDLTESASDSRGINRYRNKDARYVLPTVDEWYKAAFYDAATNTYNSFATGSNDVPVSVAFGTQEGTAVFGRPMTEGPAFVDVAGGMSAFGAVGMEGNVWELEESEFQLGNYNEHSDSPRAMRGGFWFLGASFLSSSNRQPIIDTAAEVSWVGFRVTRLIKQATIVNSKVYHGGWSGVGSGVDAKYPHKQTQTQSSLTFQNVINTSHGITGLLFVVHGLTAPGEISSTDFEFTISPQGIFDTATNPPDSWTAAPTPASIQVTSGSESQMLILWNNGQIVNRWLRIEIRANSNTGLLEPEVYFLGHIHGETTGHSGGMYTVSLADISLVRGAVGQNVNAESIFDINKDGSVTFVDVSSARGNVGMQLPNLIVP